ncbi:D-alanyl-D-alanine carboxypeptidase/D-alanyl-D-alanine endopeptidase [Usitatibacter palustris]|uniref:D-alanyl-D-alanine carboxypeptidase DacC n=1 Tax=Usitatibacter palustris TaxID=2732487 RepID=A0A6M4H8C8_9PROT|nr:D-alanyl-D-alanine carboxypeptidase/D-alanyl-D-alanine-endopeptidase [Usitatibacter palustris]QJR14634.1 D-alanyl-D-alanine carboxypeptidase DacC [Usitatibacter palustris]
MIARFMLAGALLAAGHPAVAAGIPDSIARQARAAGIPEDAITLVVQRPGDGATLASHHADRPVAPASTLKLLTALVALETFGPGYRGSAELRTRAEAVDGVLEGDLVLKGFADVDLDTAAFERMLTGLRARGIREIRGDFILDRTFFDPARTDVGLPPFDEAPEFRYNVVPDAVLLNTNLMRLELSADEKAMRVLVSTPLEGVVVSAGEMKLVDKPCEDWEDFWTIPVVKESAGTIHVRLQGEFPRRCNASTEINVIERVAFADRLFRALWTRLGGTFTGKTRDGVAPTDAIVLSTHRSRAFSQVLHDINKRSDNPITRVTYLTIGARPPDGPLLPTAERSERFVRAWMKQRGIDDAGLVLENGSGLSRKERVKASQLAAVLRAGAHSVWSAEFAASLPIVGHDGGGMRTRLRGVAIAEGTRFKTGTLKDSTGLAGYLRTAAGETRIVVAIINHENAKKGVARPLVDALVEWAATLK